MLHSPTLLLVRCTNTQTHTHTSARLPIVSTTQVSLQPQASEVMRNVDLILFFFVPTLLLRVKAGSKKKKRNLCFSHSAANKRGWDWEKRTHTPPAIKSLEFVLSAQNTQRARRGEETSRLGGKYYEGIRKTCENEDVCHRILITGCWRTVTLYPVEEYLITSGY